VLDVACADERLSDAEKLRVHEVGELIGLHGVACDLVIDRYLNSARAAE
jgi:uncharacterized tellurite resistance protein B-like protein